ncbi:Lipopolysaccharide export system ATP-binding protein LptB [Sporomusa ovata DSM 2662]|uniref:Branched-chain amino acid transport ATP-binding protein LivG (TC 3.A.1.4.1) n=1 Tax=Sporomusa ovata TaxID=2378 RepID=A0A0U1KV05_9FIRM|nr:ABC transporter ATP-binding protein [Sporomusa ovata]EQB26859.1 high-affinity branched-chain amino acid transport ATP-binding protein LivG [Sporomusa ovata DSM 2662]CQR70959.1 Branched-chain amino acid transport ATP-binding protein LivG (TC 3.A.1.4.1) [Sporomusa ovata]
MNTSSMLHVNDISKWFGGLQALSKVSISVTASTVHGIIGPNGAGKTTLFNVITGMISPDQGSVLLNGKLLPRQKPHKLVSMGIARTFQNTRLFKNMTVLENVMIGQHVHTPTPVFSIILNTEFARNWEKKTREEALIALAFVGLEAKAAEIVKNLSYGQQRLVEFARAIAAKPKLILLDEPAAGMNPTEKANLLQFVATLRENGYTIILIEHDMKLVMNICDTISVLDHGKKIAEGNPEGIRIHPEVIRAYLGKRES